VAITVAAAAFGASPKIGVTKVKIKVPVIVSAMLPLMGGNRFNRPLTSLGPFWARFNLGTLAGNVLMAFFRFMALTPIKP